ncbi:MAG: Arylsulfatase [candidate division BRC1 bacterium ADurb.BinA364]|nr:MAG: Arylsulfatase [candidate division BRC1 bacterium ADurb.BinA364]
MGAPLIAHWPQGISAGRRGAVTQQYAYLPDIMATLVEAAGAQYPERFGDRDILPLEGRSFAHLLRGEERPVHEEPIFWEHEGNRAVRKGKWKLVALNHRPWELYDIDADRTETRNLANEKPALVRELSDAWEAWAERCEVEEWGAIQRLMRESEAQKKDG